jgi:Nitroreductase family
MGRLMAVGLDPCERLRLLVSWSPYSLETPWGPVVCGRLPCAGPPGRFEETDHMDHNRLSMPLGEAIFTQRSIRRFKPDAIPVRDIRLILEAAVRAPNGGNQQIARFLVVNDRKTIRGFGELYREAWWAKRHDEGSGSAKTCRVAFTPRPGWQTRWRAYPASSSRWRCTMGRPTPSFRPCRT